MTIKKLAFSFAAIFLTAIHTISAGDTSTVKIACIGNSITFGAGIQDRAKNSYPAQLQEMLGAAYEVKNFGVSGATLLKNGNKPYWKLKQFEAAQDYQPDIVIIKLGTNDSKPPNWKHSDEFVADYTEMVKTFQSLDSEPKVWICLPVPVFETRWGINEETVVGEVIPKIKVVAAKTNVPIIDLYAPFVGKPELVPDKVHPNAKGATVLAKTVLAAISDK